MKRHSHLRRLDRVFASHPVYFITTCAHHRNPVLASEQAVAILRDEWAGACDRHGWRVGRYVVMPDHVHFFCAESARAGGKSLSEFVKRWKEWTSKRLARQQSLPPPVWQRQFFDHVLRHEESYAEKWAYVRENPVRAGLVAHASDWPWQGFIHFDSPRGEA
jgi:putative transposase